MQSVLKLYTASAGSGKTYTLAKEYIKILLLNPYHYKHILAITFTKKATAEMKHRVLHFLKQIANQQHIELQQQLIAELKEEKDIDITSTIQERAHQAIELILHDYSHFQINTIDSFFQHIIRSFAKELKLPIGLSIELDQNTVLEEAIQLLLDNYEKENFDELSNWLRKFVLNNIENDKNWRIDRNIFELSKELFKEEYLLNYANNSINTQQLSGIIDEQNNIIRKFRAYIQEKRKILLQCIQYHTLDSSLVSNNSLNSFLNKLEFLDFSNIHVIEKLLGKGDAIISNEKRKSFANESQLFIEVWNNELSVILSELITFYHQHKQSYYTATSILKNSYAMALLEYVQQELQAYKANEKIILLSDAANFIATIAQEEAVPFIYEKTANFIQYILIDEFQDTSTLQWRCFLPIILEILSKGYGLTLIVGDPKQSIYRWRGGKMELILSTIHKDLATFQSLKKEISLVSNYRSAPEIITFNNLFFDSIYNNFQHLTLIQKAYFNHQQEIKNTNKKGVVAIEWLDKDQVVLDETLQLLRQLHERYSWKDITILTRTNLEISTIANYLSTYAPEIPFLSSDSLLIKNVISIQLLIASLEILQFNSNYYELKLEHILNAYFNTVDYDLLFALQSECSYKEFFKQHNVNTTALKRKDILSIILYFVDLYKLNQQTDTFLIRFLDWTHQILKETTHSILSYLEEWHLNKDTVSIIPPSEQDAITLMTIHKSKGLEFPVVIMPYVNWSIMPKTNSKFWAYTSTNEQEQQLFPVQYTSILQDTDFAASYHHETELEIIDNINNLYVAFTRAANELYIFAKAFKTEKKVDDIKSANVLLHYILHQSELATYFKNDNSFYFGSPTTVMQHPSMVATTTIALATLKLDVLALQQPNNFNEQQLFGTIIHELLIAIHKLKEREQYIKNLLNYNYLIPTSQQQQYLNVLYGIYNLLDSKNWLDSKNSYLYETAIWYNGNEYRTDLVILTSNECIIIDYKTGQEQTSYLKQLEVYRDAYQEYFAKPVCGYLLYLDNYKLVGLN